MSLTDSRSRRRSPIAVVAAILLSAVAVQPALGVSGAAATESYTSRTLHFAVTVGPGGTQLCDVVGLLFTPASATTANRVPAILTTNGFGGSDTDQVPFAEKEAGLGYVVLSYSGLGFGGSGCKITLDDPDYDGAAASQLVSYLGGAPGIAFEDAQHTVAAPTLDVVTHDAVDHAGVAQTYDPRVGMWGGSYGGEVQFAAAAVDPRIDTINPQITWNDLSYSLGPNNADATTGVSVPDPGTVKINWGLGFSALGIFDGVQYAQNDPSRAIGCPNFATFVCPALLTAGSTGYFQPGDVAALRHASVSSYLDRIRIPVLLDQGQVDTLFNLNEAIATYRALTAQGTPVAMLWREQGHSGGTPSAAGQAYEDARIQTWFDHYLQGEPGSTGSNFAYYRDWTGTWAEAPSYPVGVTRHFYLSAGNALVDRATSIRAGQQSFVTPAAGAPTGLGTLDAVGSVAKGIPADLPDTNVAGTYAEWSTDPLADGLTVVGTPTLDVTLDAPVAALTSAAGPAGQLVLFAKIYDVAPDGSQSLVNGLVAPMRVADPGRPVSVTLPAFAHAFPAGHQIKIMVAGGDANYRGGLVATAVRIDAGSAAQVLNLPVVD